MSNLKNLIKMKSYNFASIIETANIQLTAVRSDLRQANKEYTSISSVLKDIQRSNLLKAGYAEVFKSLGIDIEKERLTPAAFFALIHESLQGTDKKGNTFTGVWGRKKEEDGTYTPVLRRISSWTPRKVFMVIAQSLAAREQK